MAIAVLPVRRVCASERQSYSCGNPVHLQSFRAASEYKSFSCHCRSYFGHHFWTGWCTLATVLCAFLLVRVQSALRYGGLQIAWIGLGVVVEWSSAVWALRRPYSDWATVEYDFLSGSVYFHVTV